MIAIIFIAANLTAATTHQAITVRRATVIAFFPPVTEQELAADADTNDALDDFQWYAGSARTPLKRGGIDFHELYVHSFRISVSGRRTVAFRPQGVRVGYYFISPGKRPRIEYGVMTDSDLFEIAREYFGITVPVPAEEPLPEPRPCEEQASKRPANFSLQPTAGRSSARG